MRKLLSIAFLFVALPLFGATIPGFRITGPIVPTSTNDTHATHEARYGKGGLRSVADITARDAIPTPRRESGMLVWVESTARLYRLDSTLTNWVVHSDALQVGTFSELSSISTSGLSSNAIVSSLGFHVVGDGGGGNYRYIPGSTLTNLPNLAVSGGALELLKWDGNVLAFGVRADGVTDDTTAFNALIDYCINSDRDVETIRLTPGTMIHSGITLTPTKDKLLRFLGESANSATAVTPYGSRILLKDGSTNVLFKVNLNPSFRLRLEGKGIYFDGNRDNCTNALDVAQWVGNGSAYVTAGVWEDCAFNRGNRHGILLTNVVYQFKGERINCQSNRDTGIWMDRGGDHHFTTFLAEKSGNNGCYMYVTENTRFQSSEFAFTGGNGLYIQDCRKAMFANCDIAVAGKSAIVLAGDAANNMFYAGFVNCRIGSPNSSLAGVPTTYPSGTYSTVTLSGSSGSHWGHVFENCMMLAFEASETTKPKHVFEDLRSNIQWTTFPGGGITLVGCAVSTATNYTTSGRFSAGFEQNANLIGLADHGAAYGLTNSLPRLTITGPLIGSGISTFGSGTNGIPALQVVGGTNAASIFTIDRPGNGKVGFAMSGDTLRIMDVTNGTTMVAFQDDGSTASIYLGGSGAARTTRIYGVLPSGTDVSGLPIRLVVGGTGAGSVANANVEIYAPTPLSSGSTVQTPYEVFRVSGLQSGKRTPLRLWDPEAGTLSIVTTTNLNSPLTGLASLVSGSVTVTNLAFASNSVPVLTYKGNPTLGGVSGTLSAAFSATNSNAVLTITSTSGTDTNQVFWTVLPKPVGTNGAVLYTGKFLVFE